MNALGIARPSRTELLVEEFRRRVAKAEGDCLLILKVKVRNGVPHKVIWSEETESDLTR